MRGTLASVDANKPLANQIRHGAPPPKKKLRVSVSNHPPRLGEINSTRRELQSIASRGSELCYASTSRANAARRIFAPPSNLTSEWTGPPNNVVVSQAPAPASHVSLSSIKCKLQRDRILSNRSMAPKSIDTNNSDLGAIPWPLREGSTAPTVPTTILMHDVRPFQAKRASKQKQEEQEGKDEPGLTTTTTSTNKPFKKRSLDEIQTVNQTLKQFSKAARPRQLQSIAHKKTTKVTGWRSKALFQESVRKQPSYGLAINMALQKGASARILDVLIGRASAANVLQDFDGPERESSLHVALRHGCPMVCVEQILSACPSAVSVVDCRNNTALHAACLFHPTDLRIIRRLVRLHPDAVKLRNFDGLTPLQILQRRMSADSNRALRYLETVAQRIA